MNEAVPALNIENRGGRRAWRAASSTKQRYSQLVGCAVAWRSMARRDAAPAWYKRQLKGEIPSSEINGEIHTRIAITAEIYSSPSPIREAANAWLPWQRAKAEATLWRGDKRRAVSW